MVTLKPQSNGPLYINTVIGTLAVDEWAVTFGTERKGLSGAAPHPSPGRAAAPLSPLLTVPNVAAHPLTASVPNLYYLMSHYTCLWTLKG